MQLETPGKTMVSFQTTVWIVGTVFSSGKFVAKYRRGHAKRPEPSTAKGAGAPAVPWQSGSSCANRHQNREPNREELRQIFTHRVGEDTWQRRWMSGSIKCSLQTRASRQATHFAVRLHAHPLSPFSPVPQRKPQVPLFSSHVHTIFKLGTRMSCLSPLNILPYEDRISNFSSFAQTWDVTYISGNTTQSWQVGEPWPLV